MGFPAMVSASSPAIVSAFFRRRQKFRESAAFDAESIVNPPRESPPHSGFVQPTI